MEHSPMSEVDKLISNYRRLVTLPWEENLADAEKVWFIVYNYTLI